MVNQHPVRFVGLGYDRLKRRLDIHVQNGNIREAVGDGGLRSYCYTEKCTYEKLWDETTTVARGLILDIDAKQIVATPFPKFFNLGERPHHTSNDPQFIPDLPFECFEKLDGSLIILFWWNGEWRTATKGSFNSDQAKWAKEKLKDYRLATLNKDTTYLCEAIYRENKIVVSYSYEGLSLLGAYTGEGEELAFGQLQQVARETGLGIARRFMYDSISELLALASSLPVSEEGFVLRFSDGYRLKIKGDEYRRIHALISRLTPLAMWEAMEAGDDLEEIRKQLPEEFWADFDKIVEILNRKVNMLVNRVMVAYRDYKDLSDKDLGMRLTDFPEDIRSFMFPYRRNKGNLLEGKTRKALFKTIRPTGNILDGYTPSYAVNKVMEEVA